MALTIIIDGPNAAHRFRHAYDKFETETSGIFTGVQYGFMEMIRGLLEEYTDTTEIYVAWEGGCIWRRELYPAYKQNRRDRANNATEDEKEDMLIFDKQQIPQTKDMLERIGIPNVMLSGLEADDTIAVLAKVLPVMMHHADNDILVVSTDKDFIQLARNRVRILNPMTNAVFATNESGQIISGRDYEPLAESAWTYLLMRAIVGDSSDNIAGVPGVGAKRAAAMLSRPWTSGTYTSYLASIRDLLATKAYGDRLVQNTPTVVRNLALMALVSPYCSVGLKRAGYRGITHVASEVMTAAAVAEKRVQETLITDAKPTADPSAFLTYFRRLEFQWANRPNESTHIRQLLNMLRLNKRPNRRS